MVTLIEQELKVKDKELKELLNGLSIETSPSVSSKVNSIATEKEILHKLLNKQRLKRRKGLIALESGLLLFAISMFGILGSFAFYMVSGTTTPGTWEQMGSEMAVLVLLLTMTTISTALYLQHYKSKLS